MVKICIAFLLAVPAAVLAQNAQSSSLISASDSGSSALIEPAAGGQSGQPATGRGVFTRLGHQAPVGSFTASAVYMYSPNLAGANRSLMGWAAVQEVNFTKYLGLQADFEGLYVRAIYPGQKRLVIAAGPRINFAPRSKFTPFIFMEGGEVRLSTKANRLSDWNPVAKGGFGFDYKIVRGFGLQLIPGEYQGQHLDNDTWTHSYSARAGISFSLYR